MKHVAIIGAGIGGLAAAMRLAHGGVKVTVLEVSGDSWRQNAQLALRRRYDRCWPNCFNDETGF